MLRRKNGAVPPLMLNMLLAYSGYGMSVPVMPAYMDELGLTGATIGFLFAAFSVMQLAFSPAAGRWSDTYGRKRMIVGGLVVFALSEWMFGAAHTLVPLYVSRLLGGAGTAFMTPAVMAYVSDVTTEDERARGISFINAAISTGFVIGPGLGGLIAVYGVRMPFYSAAVVGGLAACISMLFLPESRHLKQAAEDHRGHAENNETLSRQLSRSMRPPYRYGSLVTFVLAIGLAIFETIYGLYADRKYGLTPQHIAVIVTGSAILGALVQITALGTLLNRLGERRVMTACLAAGGGGLLAFMLAHGYWSVLASHLPCFFGFGHAATCR
ncbi:MFS transporter [Paenibacillus sp. P25]|nr:MFS transporter [Paenibacillus sp. P25]